MTQVSEKIRMQVFATLEQIASHYNNKDINALISTLDPKFRCVIELKEVSELEKVKEILLQHYKGERKRIIRFTDITLNKEGVLIRVIAQCTLWKTDNEEITEKNYPITLLLKETSLDWKIIYFEI